MTLFKTRKEKKGVQTVSQLSVYRGNKAITLFQVCARSRKTLTATQTAHRELKSTAFTTKLTKFFSLSHHQLASASHRLGPKRGEMSPPGSLNRYTSGLRLKLKLMLSAGCSHSGTDGVVDLCVQCQHPLPIQQLFEQCLCSQLSPIFLFFFRSEWAD